MEYQLPRLTKMWSHLERQSGGQVKGMGEKQIEVDKRILRDQVFSLLSATVSDMCIVSLAVNRVYSLCLVIQVLVLSVY